jgi:hypothetical protein
LTTCALAVAAILIQAHSARGAAHDTVAVPAEVERTFAAVRSVANRLDAVWPGYWNDRRAFLVVEPQLVAVLHAPGDPGSPFRAQRVCAPTFGCWDAWIYRGAIPGLSASQGFFDLEFPVAGTSAVAISVRGSLEKNLYFLFHEGFHAHQETAFADPHVLQVNDSLGAATRDRVHTMADAERARLAAALDDEHGDVLAALREYLRMRAARDSLTPASLRHYEDRLERIEGSAQLVGVQASLLAQRQPTADAARAVAGELRQPIRLGAFATGETWHIRSRVYGTGAALGLLFDRLGLPWRQRLAAGEDFRQIATSVAGLPSPDRNAP